MLKCSEFAQAMENESHLKGFKIAWDAAMSIDDEDWIIGWPKLQIERKIRSCATDDLLEWIKKWKSQRYINMFVLCYNY